MNACKNCFENNWKYQYSEGFIHATCQLCGFEVEFKGRKLREQEIRETDKNEMGSGYNIRKGIDLALLYK